MRCEKCQVSWTAPVQACPECGVSTPSGKEDPRRKDIGFERWRCNERPADRVHMRGNQDNELWWNEESLRAAWIAGATFAPSERSAMPEGQHALCPSCGSPCILHPLSSAAGITAVRTPVSAIGAIDGWRLVSIMRIDGKGPAVRCSLQHLGHSSVSEGPEFVYMVAEKK